MYNEDRLSLVYLDEEGVYGIVVETAAEFALVQYSLDGIMHREYFEEDEYRVIGSLELNLEEG